MTTSRPLVSVVTPIFNGSQYIAQCITSIQKQTYDNWHYTIVDNLSTDASFDICMTFAKADPRITVKKNTMFVPQITNYNNAIESISPHSKYCKFICADDWLFPNCLESLVELAENHPSVGIVGAYRMNIHGVPLCNLPLDRTAFDGKNICRLFLLGSIDAFWLPTAVLYRSDCIRRNQPFFPGLAPSADLEACLRVLSYTDFGFVHQILSYEGISEETVTAEVKRRSSYLLDRIRVLQEYGHTHLDSSEYDQRLNALLSTYYNDVLAAGFINMREFEFWRTHASRLRELGYSVADKRLLFGILKRLTDLLFNPKQAAEKLLRRI